MDVTTALIDMHASGFGHFDLKPDNIIYSASGSFKLIDFGSSRPIGHHALPSQVWCTYAYAPPEALTGKYLPMTFEVGSKIDAYSLGAVLFFCIYAGYLFNPSKMQHRRDALREHVMGRVIRPAPHKRPLHVPVDIWHVICSLLHPNPSQRMSVADAYDVLLAGSGHSSSATGYEPGQSLSHHYLESLVRGFMGGERSEAPWCEK